MKTKIMCNNTPARVYKLDPKTQEEGLKLNVSIQFFNGEVLACCISQGYDCVDYAMALNTSLADVIEEFVKK